MKKTQLSLIVAGAPGGRSRALSKAVSDPCSLPASLPVSRSISHPKLSAEHCYQRHHNQLLDMLPDSVLAHLPGARTPVSLEKGAVLYEAGSLPSDIYFPTTLVVSLVHLLRDGTAPEFALVGNKGMVGVQSFMGGATMPHSAIVQSPGFAFRIRRDDFQREVDRSGGRRKGILQNVLKRYSQVLLTQLAQISICNGHHALRERLCRWLLLASDRTVADTLHVTHENIAALLGVRREGVTAAAGQLQSAGLIHYSRGRIELIDRAGLENEVCECYQVIRSECERLLTPCDEPHAKPAEPSAAHQARRRAHVEAIWPAVTARSAAASKRRHELQAV